MALNVVSSDRLSTNVKTSNLATGLSSKVGENKNLLINGAAQIHQRGGTTTSSGYLLDRWYFSTAGGTATCSQGTETSGTVYEKGLSKYIRITNTANSTAVGSYRYILQRLEGQDIVNSGWNFKSASSYITLSFWVRSSHAQNFYGYLRALDSPDSKYLFDTGSLTADTWTKVTKKIPGYTSMAIDNDNTGAFEVLLSPFWGTNFTASPSLNTWAAWNSGERAPDYATTWAAANGATFDITGVQLEVGETATEFEHSSYGDELYRCQRYYEQFNSEGQAEAMFAAGYFESETVHKSLLTYVDKRAAPTITFSAANSFSVINTGAMPAGSSIGTIKLMKKAASLTITLSTSISGSDGTAGVLSQVGAGSGTPEATIKVDAEI